MKPSKWIIPALIFIYFVGVFLRVNSYDNALTLKYPPYYSEMASHFKYSQLIAQGHSLPETDYSLQYPEGFQVSKRTPVFMYYVIGYIGRFALIMGVDFYTLTLVLPSFFYCITVFTLYFTAKLLLKDDFASLSAAFLYAVSMASLSRSMSGLLLYEQLALPLIFLHLYFFIKSTASGNARQSMLSSLASAIFLYLAYMTWKVTGYYFLVLTSTVSLIWFAWRRDTSKLVHSYFIQLVFSILASVTIPHMISAKQFYHPALLLGLALFLSHLTSLNRRTNLFWKAGTCIVLFILFISIAPENMDYSHVSGVYYHKIINLGEKPYSNPASMPYEVRMYWVSQNDAPSLGVILSLFTILPLGLIALIYFTIKWGKKMDSKKIMILLLTFFLLVLFILSNRIIVFIIFFLTLFYGALMSEINKRISKNTVLILLSSLLLLETGMGYLTFRDHNPSLGKNMINLLDAIESKTPQNSIILAQYFISSNINAYTNRTVLLNPFWESAKIRQKNELFDYAHLKPPQEYTALLKKYNVTHFVYIKGFYNASNYYLAANPPKSSMMHELEYNSGEISNTKLLYQNPDYSLYQIK